MNTPRMVYPPRLQHQSLTCNFLFLVMTMDEEKEGLVLGRKAEGNFVEDDAA